MPPGKALRALRQATGMSPQALFIKMAVYHYHLLEEMEEGRLPIPMHLHQPLATALGISLESFRDKVFGDTKVGD